MAKVLPYTVTRTWHVQIGVFWIATAWLAAGLFMGPLVSGYEPKHQKLGVHVLFGALLLIVAGSLAGEWLSVQNKLSDNASFLWGHQGYEYLDLGRGWQWLLFAGLFIWLFLTLRPIAPLLKEKAKSQLLWLFVISSAAIGLFYGAGLTWGNTRTYRWLSIGGGGWSIFGWKASSRSSQPRSSHFSSADWD